MSRAPLFRSTAAWAWAISSKNIVIRELGIVDRWRLADLAKPSLDGRNDAAPRAVDTTTVDMNANQRSRV